VRQILNSRLINLLLIIGTTALGLGVAEFVLRVAGIANPGFHRLDAEVGDALDPGAEGWWTREGRAYVRINGQGLRDVEHTLAKPPGVIRIAVLGDSFAEALQVELEQTFWRVMARRLETCPSFAGHDVEVINFGVSGYGTAQELLTLRRRALRYAPDVVLLLFTTGNDVRNNSKDLQHGGRPLAELRDDTIGFDMTFLDTPSARLQLSPVGRFYYWARHHSRVVQLLGRLQLRGSADKAPGANSSIRREPGLDDEVYREPSDSKWRDAWNLTQALLVAARDESKANGARFLLATGSSPIQVDPNPAVREAFAKELGVIDLLYPDRRIEALAARENIPFVMLAPALLEWAQGHNTCVHGFDSNQSCVGHWNADGHRVVGERLASMLCATATTPLRVAAPGAPRRP